MLVAGRVGSASSHLPEQAVGWGDITWNHSIIRHLTCHSMSPALDAQLDKKRTWASVRLHGLSLQTLLSFLCSPAGLGSASLTSVSAL